MKVAGRSLLDVFCHRHADAKQWIERWLSEVEETSWQTPQQVVQRYILAQVGANNRVTFDVNGLYRLEVTVAYRAGAVVVRWAGTRVEYDQRNR